jgi:hypothetical protein
MRCGRNNQLSAVSHQPSAIGVGTAVLLFVLNPARATAQTRIGVDFESGLEFDSNATRVADEFLPVASPDWRLTAGLQLLTRPASGQVFSLSQSAGGKIFLSPDAQGENIVVDDTHAAWSVTLAPSATLQMALDYYDALQQSSTADPRRDFRQGSLGPRLVLLPEPDVQVVAFGGYRAFQFKLDKQQDFWGPYFGAQVRKRWLTGPEEDEREWELALTYEANPRRFNGYAYDNVAMSPPVGDRGDLFHYGELRATWTGPVLLGLAYGLQYNDSNSYGFGWLRHVVTARFAMQLPAGFSLAARAVLQILQLSDSVLLDPSVNRGDTFDNENRSSVEIGIDHGLTQHLRFVVRYAYYTSVLGTNAGVDPRQVDFSRHLTFTGVAYRFDH